MSKPYSTHTSPGKGARRPPRAPDAEDVYLVVPACPFAVLPFDRAWSIAWFHHPGHLRVIELTETPHFQYNGVLSRKGDLKGDFAIPVACLAREQRNILENVALEAPVLPKRPDSVWNRQSWVKEVLWSAANMKLLDLDEVQECIAAATKATYSW